MNRVNRIASFSVNHDFIEPGIYISRVDGDCVTYDVRMKTPNAGDYLSTGEAHTIEHLFATYARNSELSDEVVYVGPMGCRTGFYLILRDSVPTDRAIDLCRKTFEFIAKFEGKIPGAERRECGNWLDHDLEAAKRSAAEFSRVIGAWRADMTAYPG